MGEGNLYRSVIQQKNNSTNVNVDDWLDYCILDWNNTPPPDGTAWPERIDCRPVEEFVDNSSIKDLLSMHEYNIGNEMKLKKFTIATSLEQLTKHNLSTHTQLILNTLEFYLSDEFLVRSKFLVSQITRNIQGYVSLKLLASFRSLPDMIDDVEQLRNVIQYSTVLRLSKDTFKVKRQVPIPREIVNYHKAMQNRALKWFLVITNIPETNNNSNYSSFDLVANVIYKLNLVINNVYFHWDCDTPNSLMSSYLKQNNIGSTNAVFIEIRKDISCQSIFKNLELINVFNMNIDIFKAKEMLNKNVIIYSMNNNSRKN